MSVVTYTYFGPIWAHGGSQSLINIGVIHDVEAPTVPGMARSLCGPNYFGHGGDPNNPVSIHYIVGPDDICQGTDENTIAWHVGRGNQGTIGIEQCGYSSYSRQTWLDPEGIAQGNNLAKLMHDISNRRPLIRKQWLTDAELVYAWNNKSTPGGWTTHAQMTRVGLGSTHTDPGLYWPADYVMNLVNSNTQPPEVIDMPLSQADLDAITRIVQNTVWGIMTNPDLLALDDKALFAANTGAGGFAAQIANIASDTAATRAALKA